MQKINFIRKGTEKDFLSKWIDTSTIDPTPDIDKRCNKEYLSECLEGLQAELGSLEISSISIVTSGKYEHPVPTGLPLEIYAELYKAENLPDFCEVIVNHETPGSVIEHITVWVPFVWNQRFMGMTGGSTRNKGYWLDTVLAAHMRTIGLPVAIRNGFAAASTDAGNDDFTKMYGWGLDPETKKVDRERIKNFAGRSDHWAAVVGKAITEALHKGKIQYSYIFGSSNGGRQSIMEALNYPEDYDGVWADSPAVNWNLFMPNMLWPPVVMNTKKHVIPLPKLEAFRQAVIDKYGHDKYFSMVERPEFDAREAIGIQTEEGPITEKDAEIMQIIWDGSTVADGTHFPGIRPGGDAVFGGVGILYTTKDENGKWEAVPNQLPMEVTANWIKCDENWDWHTMTLEDFFDSVAAWHILYPELDCNSPDLSAFRQAGHKLIITHGTDDHLIVADNSIDYYNKVVAFFKGKEYVDDFLRFYLIPGDGHGEYSKNGSGPSLATGMVALMEWVENGIKPQSLLGQHYDLMTGEITDKKVIAPY